jgi:hypothetical protein
MSRIRYLKPEFFKDEDLAGLPYEVRLFYAGLWGLADKAGRLEDRPLRLKAEIFPYDPVDPEKCLSLLSKSKRGSGRPFIHRYTTDNQRYIQILQWDKHQKPHHTERESEIPPAPLDIEDIWCRDENLFFGDVPDDLIELACKLLPTEKAGEWQDLVENEVKKLGYKVQREVPCSIDDNRNGRIDLIAQKGEITIAIELDYRTPRSKSIKKVKHYPCGMVLLRDPKIRRKVTKEELTGTEKEKGTEKQDEASAELSNGSVTVTDNKLLDEFEKARKLYPGTKRGRDTEFADFKKKHRDFAVIVPLLYSAISNQIESRQKAGPDDFVPSWKYFRTWLNNKCWEDETAVWSKKNGRAGEDRRHPEQKQLIEFVR